MRPLTTPPASMLALPLRVGADGRLARGAPVDELVRLFRVMAATSARAWPHAPWFGLAEVFAAANVELQDQQGLADALNRALAGLGVGWAHVAHVQSVPGGYGERAFRIALETG
ncbi:MAG TPA: hypothetical protein VGD56_15640, partial [Gemmatirosa sp.]